MTNGLRIAHLRIAPQWAILRWAILRVIKNLWKKFVLDELIKPIEIRDSNSLLQFPCCAFARYIILGWWKINQWKIPSVDTKYREEERISEEIFVLTSREYFLLPQGIIFSALIKDISFPFLPLGWGSENICVFVSDKDLSALEQEERRC